ncbi:unnamed protein product [Cutaneotrichosporon oleaginosum]
MASYHPVPSLYSLTDVGSMDSIHLHDQTSHPVAAAVRTAKRPPWSLRRTYRDSSSDERVYLCVVLFEAVTVTALAMAAFLVMVTRMPPSNKQTLGVSVYMAIFVLGRYVPPPPPPPPSPRPLFAVSHSLFSLLYSLDAIRARNVIQLCMFVYAVTEIPQTRSALRNLDDARACVPRGGTYDCLGKGSLYFILLNILVWPIVITAIATAGYVFLARRLYVQFGWEEFRILNASIGLKRMYRTYACMVSLLKLLAFFASAFCMAYIVLITALWRDKTELIITVIALPVFYPTIAVTGWALITEDAA